METLQLNDAPIEATKGVPQGVDVLTIPLGVRYLAPSGVISEVALLHVSLFLFIYFKYIILYIHISNILFYIYIYSIYS